jgi:hypothetical protein
MSFSLVWPIDWDILPVGVNTILGKQYIIPSTQDEELYVDN